MEQVQEIPGKMVSTWNDEVKAVIDNPFPIFITYTNSKIQTIKSFL